MKEIILINVSGADRPGLTFAITEALAKHNVYILDISQSVIHNKLSLDMLIEVPKKSASSPILKDLLFTSHQLGLTAKFSPIDESHYGKWVGEEGKPRNIVTLLARKIDAGQITTVSRIITSHNLNIDNITRISGRLPLTGKSRSTNACVEFSARGEPADRDRMGSDFLAAAGKLGVDIAFQEDNIFRCNRRLIVFDMDSTLIQAEVIDELAKANRTADRVSHITDRAMRGELDFAESLRLRVKLLRGLKESALAEVARKLPLTEGAEQLIATLKHLGFSTAILSGGFRYFGERLKERLGIDYVFANRLDIEDGIVTGEVRGEIVDGPKKAELLQEIAKKENITLEQVIAVGDGANDLPMLNRAGLGIAFQAKPIVRRSTRQAISEMGLDGILYLIGYRDRYAIQSGRN